MNSKQDKGVSKLEGVNRIITQMINCKNPFDSSIAALKACKEAITGIKRITLFVFDIDLQHFIAKS